jgi:RNA polymerase sigma-70 factor (ECF subfamily)
MTVWIYSLLTQFHRDQQNRLHSATAAGESLSLYGSSISDKLIGHGHPTDGLGAGLAALTLEEREVLLLVVLEGFSYSQASHILRISRGMLIARLAHARVALSSVIGAKVSPSPLPRRPPYLRVIK